MRKESNYNNSVIYVLESMDGLHQYIGGSSNYLARRYHHWYRYSNPVSDKHKYQIYEVIRAYGGWDNFRFRILRRVNCETVEELRAIEGIYINLLSPSMNSYGVGIKRRDILNRAKIANGY